MISNQNAKSVRLKAFSSAKRISAIFEQFFLTIAKNLKRSKQRHPVNETVTLEMKSINLKMKKKSKITLQGLAKMNQPIALVISDLATSYFHSFLFFFLRFFFSSWWK